jgi:uncharacterized damage-inducible protein DinB
VEYHLYLESGPKRRKTQARVIDLVGCVELFPNTGEAIAGAPRMIRAYLSFLQARGEPVDEGAPFDVVIQTEDLHGGFLGIAYIEADASPIDATEAEALRRRYGWIRAATLDLVEPLDAGQLEAQPAMGRPVGRILSHILGADYGYVTSGFKIEGLHALANAADRREADPRVLLRQGFELIDARLRAMNDEERVIVKQRSGGPWTVRHMYRRLLEHNWEHCQEIARRLAERRTLGRRLGASQ